MTSRTIANHTDPRSSRREVTGLRFGGGGTHRFGGKVGVDAHPLGAGALVLARSGSILDGLVCC